MSYTVIVTDKNAIYVNDTRITNRSTKWGIHHTLDEFVCEQKEDIRKRCISRGWEIPASKIDIEGY